MRKSRLALAALALAAAGGYAMIQNAGGVRDQVARAVTGISGPTEAAAPAGGTGSQAAEAIPVEAVVATAGQAVRELRSVGTLASDESVDVAAELPGRITAIAFREGEPVRAGEVLVRLDNALARAEAADATAKLALADANFERANSLSKSGSGTQRARDEALAALETARAAVELTRARLEKMEIRAPFNGVVGLRRVSVGAFAQIGQPLVNIEKIDALKLDFQLPEINLADVRVGMPVEIAVDAFPNETFSGTIYAIDPHLDVNGRSLRIRARLTNPEGMLRPGLFSRVTLRGETRGPVVLVPESAIVPRAGETFVYVVRDGRAIETKVRLGRRLAGEVEVIDGLEPNETVVVAGQIRLKDAALVEIVSAPTATD
jgi:membrane fusion protein (multidrug efflux system)